MLFTGCEVHTEKYRANTRANTESLSPLYIERSQNDKWDIRLK